jgi:hypothetical protein
MWEGKGCNPILMVGWSMRYLEDYQQHHPTKTPKKKRAPSKWVCPPRGRLKVNVDGSFNPSSSSGGLGVMVRDELGRCVVALSRCVQLATSARGSFGIACYFRIAAC